jgi:hypothetical protein
MSVRGPVIEPRAGGLRIPTAPRPVPRAASSRRGRLGVAGLLLAGLLVSTAAASTESLLPESVRPVPAALAGVFGTTGLNLHVTGAIAVLVLMFVSYLGVVRWSAEISPRWVIAAIALLHAFVLLAPPLISTDVFSYQAYARMGAHYGVNPYVNGPYAIRLDGVFPYVGAKWSYIPSAYGPAFTAFSYLLAPLSIATSVIAYKSIAALASLALVAVVWRCAQLRGSDPVRAAALVGLNPLLVVYGVGGGHNDLLMLLALAGSLYAVLAGRDRAGGGLSMLAVGIKLTAGLTLPFALAECLRRRPGRPGLLVGAAAGLAVVAALSFAVFGSGALHLLATVSQSQSEGDWKSIPGAISDRLGAPGLGHAVGLALAGCFAGVAGWLVVRVARGQLDWIDGAGWATLAMLLASSSLLPWYVGWLLPLAALARDPRLRTCALAMTGVVQFIQLLGYIPHG